MALNAAFGAAVMGVPSAHGADFTYTGNESTNLHKDPTGDQSAAASYESLYADGVYTDNIITVNGGTDGVQSHWNTDGANAVAPYVIYGAVNVEIAGYNSPGGNGSDLQYDWSAHKAFNFSQETQQHGFISPVDAGWLFFMPDRKSFFGCCYLGRYRNFGS